MVGTALTGEAWARLESLRGVQGELAADMNLFGEQDVRNGKVGRSQNSNGRLGKFNSFQRP